MQSWGSGFGKGGSRYQPYGRTTQQRGATFFDKGTSDDLRNMSFGSGTSFAREYKSSSRGNITVGLDSSNWGSRSLDRGFQKRESRSHDMTFRQKREFNDSYEKFQRSEEYLNKGDYDDSSRFQSKMLGGKKGGIIKFDSYQTSFKNFGLSANRSSDRSNSFGKKDYDTLDSYRTTESRGKWSDKEPYESLLNRTKIDIDSYRTATGGSTGIFGSSSKTERYQTSNSPRSMSKPVDMYNRSSNLNLDFNTQVRGSSGFYNTQDSRRDYLDKGSNRNYDGLLNKYNFQGDTGNGFNNRSSLENNSSKMVNLQNIDSYSTSNNITDFETSSERIGRHGGNYSRSSDPSKGDNLWRSEMSSRLDYIIGRNEDDMSMMQRGVGSRGQNREMDFVGSGFNKNENASQMRNRMNSSQDGFSQRVHTSSGRNESRQHESYFTQGSNRSDMFVPEESMSRKNISFESRRQGIKSMVQEDTLFRRQLGRQQEREENQEFQHKKRQDQRAMGHQLQRSTEMMNDQTQRGNQDVFNKQRSREMRDLPMSRSQEMERNNRRMIQESKVEQERRILALNSNQRMIEDRRQQEEMRQRGKLNIQQNINEQFQTAARKKLLEKQARAMAIKNQVTIAKQQAQERTIAMQATLLKRQRQIAEVMRKRQIMSQNLRNQALTKTRLRSSALALAMGQRLKDRARLLETQRRSLEIRSRLIRKQNVAHGDRESRGLQRDHRASSDKTDRKHTTAQSPQKSSMHCDVCNMKVTVPFKLHVQSPLHKAKLKQQEATHAKNIEMFYCDACCFKVKGPAEYHNALEQHQNREKSMKNGCVACSIASFSDGKELDKHRASLQHQKILKQGKTPEGQKISSMFCDICNIKINVSIKMHQQSTSHKEREMLLKKGCTLCSIPSFSDGKKLDEHRGSLQHAKSAKEKSEMLINAHLMEFKTENDIPAFVSGKAFGVEFIIRSQGYACQICQKGRKFYLSEQSAKVDHCKLKEHYCHWKEHETKLIMAESEAKRTKTPDTKSKVSAKQNKADKKPEEGKINVSTENKAVDEIKLKESSVQMKMKVDKKVAEIVVKNETTKIETENEFEKQTSAEEQDLENFEILDSVESDTDQETISSVGKEEENLKSEKSELATVETTNIQDSPRGRGRGRIQKARRGRKINKT